jgi:hypothetical protein
MVIILNQIKELMTVHHTLSFLGEAVVLKMYPILSWRGRLKMQRLSVTSGSNINYVT